MSTRKLLLCGCMALGLGVAGCSEKTHLTPPKRTVNEQPLLDQSLQRTLSNATLPLLPGKTVAVEVASLAEAGDQAFVQAAITRWLAQQGFRVPGDKQENYILRLMVHSFSTNVAETFAGIPPIHQPDRQDRLIDRPAPSSPLTEVPADRPGSAAFNATRADSLPAIAAAPRRRSGWS